MIYPYFISESMKHTKRNVDNLFLNADNMNSEDLDARFKAIMKDGEKSIEKSGNIFKKKSFIIIFKIIILIFRDQNSNSQRYASSYGKMHEFVRQPNT